MKLSFPIRNCQEASILLKEPEKRHRVLLPVQNRRFHRNPLRLHCSSERLVFTSSDGREMSERNVEPPSEYQIQRNLLHRTERGSSHLLRRRNQRMQENLNYYKKNAKVIADTLTELQIPFYGGIHSPYIWFECPTTWTPGPASTTYLKTSRW